MKITSIKTAATVGHGMHLWVRVTTDAGITGTGECVHGGKQAIAIIQYSEVAHFQKDAFNYTAIQWEHERMVQLVEMVTSAAGKEVAMAVHTRLDVPSAIRLVQDLAPYHLM